MIVTAVERQRYRKRVGVFVDGELTLTLGAELAAERDVRPGRTITRSEIAALADAEAKRGALESALRLLAHRPRSEKELRDRLARKGFLGQPIDEAIVRLRELGYLNDAAFARFWIDTRQTMRPRSQRLLTSELRWRGIEQELAVEVTADISDDDAAYDAASRRLGSLRGLEYQRFRERLGGFLTRRGFGYEIARRTIERCWAELAGEDGHEGGTHAP
ncbi:MAG: regulatory protein RecX [Dehalococcoidia bacterium]